MHSKPKRIAALIGAITLILLFIATIVFLIIGQINIAILLVGINGFLAVILYFIGRFNTNTIDANEDISNKQGK